MLHRSAVALFILAIVFSLANPVPAQAGSGDTFAAVLTQRMPELLAKYRVPGAVVSYIQNGEVAWTQAFGLANQSTRAAMSADMIFNFGSTGKVLTGWGVMRLVEQGKVELDTPVNRYLKRWQIQSNLFNPEKVTIRRLLSHTAGLTASGFSDYSQRRRLPSLVEMLAGENQTDGPVVLFQQPGQGFQYSGGGYVLLQMIIEDVTGQPFAQFMRREVTAPLGLPTLFWTWTPELQAHAPMPYGPEQEPLGYRQLASQAVGSEVGTVTDFARFVAAAVPGLNNEPAGRGVLQPDTIAEMINLQPGAEDEGLAYGVTPTATGVLLQHFGSNPGWSAFFTLDTSQREGLVMANNSSNGFPLNAAVQNLWLSVLNGKGSKAFEPPFDTQLSPVSTAALVLTGLLALPLVISLVVFFLQLRSLKRVRTRRPTAGGLVGAGIWALLAGGWVYWFYASLPLPFPPGFPDLWRTPEIDLVTAALVTWAAFTLAGSWFPRKGEKTRGSERFSAS